MKENFGLNTAMVSGSVEGRTTVPKLKSDLNTVLTCFSPISKDKHLLMPNDKTEIDFLIATDCISEGQNLQDCDYLINYDIHWNPVRIIQRFGRIDRIGSKNAFIQLVNFWPDVTLDEYIDLKAKVETRMKIVDMTATGDDNLLSDEEKTDLEYRKAQLKRLQEEVVDIEDMMADNIKEDRTPEDLLFQVMLDLGVELSSKIEETVIAGKKVFDVADGFLIACFDKDVNDETIKAIAQKQPYYFVMRDSSLANDSVATNFEQIFATYSPDTVRKVL